MGITEEVLHMQQENLINSIAELEREIAVLPEGSITKKNIKGKDYYYHRVNRNGKRVENYIKFEEVSELQSQIARRKDLEKQLKKLNSQIAPNDILENEATKQLNFNTMVRTGNYLKSQIAIARKYKKRRCISELREYIFGGQQDKVFVLYGLRRTGKTTMIRQILTELPEGEFSKAAFIQVSSKDALSDVDADLRLLESNGFKYVFIDEVTLMEDFIEGAAIFADIYASSGIKIVLSGTDSLGFAFSKEEQLYDRCIMLHTTFIPYREFEDVLGIKGIDEYIRYGGTMSLGGVNYNEDATFATAKSAEEYIDTAIAKNIQHSLKMYQYGGHFRQLLDLYERGELTNVINRVVENINHSFTRSVVEKTFAIMQMLDILNKEEQSIDIEESHMIQIKEYLNLLDLIMEIDVEYLPEVEKRGKITVITQPGMRYAQANAIVENLLLDAKFKELSLKERQRIVERLLSEIRGRMMEEIVLLETQMANKEKKVFKLQFAIGEFDMVVFDPKALNCKIYEVKYSKEYIPEQYRHLKDENKCAMTSHRYGDIVGRYVIYRGEDTVLDGIEYLNVEKYLKSL
jgi:predicted AAA+ superfamily ATPase